MKKNRKDITMLYFNKKNGFTLIELLIVIGIVAILLGIVLVAVNPASQFGKANDAERKSELGAILGAVYQFQTSPSARGALPQCTVNGVPTAIPDCDGAGTGGYDGAIQLGTAATNYDCTAALVPNYLREIPIDPTSTYNASATGYSICKQDVAGVSRVFVIAPGTEVFTDDGGCQVPGTTTATMCISG